VRATVAPPLTASEFWSLVDGVDFGELAAERGGAHGAKTLASWKGQTFKAWLERAIAEVVERQEDERIEDERQRRLR
jgi:hypothetical protein